MNQDNPINRYADAAREYLKLKKVYRYRMKKIEDMSDEEVCEKCHWWCEENNLVDDYRKFEDKFFNR